MPLHSFSTFSLLLGFSYCSSTTSFIVPPLIHLLFPLFLSLTDSPSPYSTLFSAQPFFGLFLQTVHVEVSVTFPEVPLSMVPLISVSVNGASGSPLPPRVCVMPSHSAARSIALLPPSPGQSLTGLLGGGHGGAL